MSAEQIRDNSESEYPLMGVIWKFGRSNVPYLVLAMVLSTTVTIIGFADVFLIGLAIDALFNDQSFTLPLLSIETAAMNPLELLFLIAGVVFLINLFDSIGTALAEYCYGLFAQRVLHQIRTDVFEDVLRQNVAFFDNYQTGDVMSVLNSDINQLNSFITTILNSSIWIVFSLVAAIVYMSLLNLTLAVIVLTLGPIVAAVNYWFSRRLEPIQAEVRKEQGELNSKLESNISGIEVIKSFTAEPYESDRVRDYSRQYLESKFDAQRLSIRQSPINRLLGGSWLLLTFGVGVYWIVNGAPSFLPGTVTAGELIPFLLYLERISLPLKNLAGVIDGYESGRASARRIDGLRRLDSRSIDESGEELRVEDASIEYDDVTFSYPETTRTAVDGITFETSSSETIGLVGPTGAGKSTIIKLLLRLYDPDSGSISIDGQDVRDVSLESLRNSIGYVSQDSFIFDGSVAYNIAYGSEDVSEEQIRWAAKQAGAHEFIVDLRDGYETTIGGNDGDLSGGQKQRIAIARAIVDDPKILVFDEATSHVDNETEMIIQESFEKLGQDRTMFVVAHRLSTVRDADEILVIEDGAIVESGTHPELIEQDGLYERLWRLQTGEPTSLSAANSEK